MYMEMELAMEMDVKTNKEMDMVTGIRIGREMEMKMEM